MVSVSVIMPVYNTNHKLLCRAIDSILKQSLESIELILVDDGSTNGCSSICDEYAGQDGRVHVIHQANGGLCKARNAGMRIAKGEYITFSDHDDEFGNNQLEDNYALAKKFQDAEIIKYGYRYVCLDQKPRFPFKKYEVEEPRLISGRELLPEFIKLKASGCLTFIWDALFSQKFLRKNHIVFNERFKYGQEDIEFCNQAFMHLKCMVYNPVKYYIHYRYPSSTSRGMDYRKTEQLLHDEIYVMHSELHVFEKMFSPADTDIKQAILCRNFMVMLSSVMREDARISFSQRLALSREVRKCFTGDYVLNWHQPSSINIQICLFLFQHNLILLVVLLSRAYVYVISRKCKMHCPDVKG